MGERNTEAIERLSEPLTRRERQVLGLLAQGLTAPEIAERLTLAVSSVKWHVQQLYGKLGVNGKRQAVARARDLGLLEPAASPALPTLPPMAPASERLESPRPRHNLPAQVTEFFGREHEIARLRQQLTSRRLVTLTGSGGVGKTRLSLRAAEQLVDDYDDGVWLVQLAPLTDAGLVAQTVAVTLGVRDVPGRPALDILAETLRERRLLLVLDNCEHLLEASARLVDGLLTACPRLKILASSREPLGVGGEAVFPVPSLPFPAPDEPLAVARLDSYPAVQLFADRARLVVPDYELGDHNTAAVAHICQRLDGIPLALEMAAARLRLLDAGQLAGRLDDAFRVLTGGSRTALPRQQTLRATIDWSYHLLNEPERRLLQRLSVFAGGCTLEAAEAVCSDPGETAAGVGSGQVMDLLAVLVDKSMVLASREPGRSPHYRLLETVRQYAREKLNDSGEGAYVRVRHRDYFLHWVETWAARFRSKDWSQALDHIVAALENVRPALEWSFGDASAPDAAPRLVLATGYMWPTHRESLDCARRAVAHCEAQAEVVRHDYARLLVLLSNLTALNDPAEALRLALQAVEVSRSLGPAGTLDLLVSLLCLAGKYAIDLSDPEPAVAIVAEAEALLPALRNTASPEQALDLEKRVLLMQAEVASARGQPQPIRQYAAGALRLNAGIQFPPHAMGARTLMAEAYLAEGAYGEARAMLLPALDLTEDRFGEWSYNHRSLVFHLLGETAGAVGQAAEALGYYQASVRLALQIYDNNLLATNLAKVAITLAPLGQAVLAATLSGAAQTLYARQGRKPSEDSALDTLFPGWRDSPDAALLAAAYAAGQAMTPAEAGAAVLDAQA
jgi:predicted ATPase/DNA-binding CsgD family transcriptional regulator